MITCEDGNLRIKWFSWNAKISLLYHKLSAGLVHIDTVFRDD